MVGRSTHEASGLNLGPFSSTARARAAATTLSGLFGVRTCTLKLNGKAFEPCALYDLGSCHGPCTATDDDIAAHDAATAGLRDDLASNGLTLARKRLAEKLATLVAQSRFEEAAAHRDAFTDVARAVDRSGRLRAIAHAGRIEFATPDGNVLLENGVLADGGFGGLPRGEGERASGADHGLALGERGLLERQAIAAWLERAEHVRLVSSQRPLAFPWPRAVLLERLELQEFVK